MRQVQTSVLCTEETGSCMPTVTHSHCRACITAQWWTGLGVLTRGGTEGAGQTGRGLWTALGAEGAGWALPPCGRGRAQAVGTGVVVQVEGAGSPRCRHTEPAWGGDQQGRRGHDPGVKGRAHPGQRPWPPGLLRSRDRSEKGRDE